MKLLKPIRTKVTSNGDENLLVHLAYDAASAQIRIVAYSHNLVNDSENTKIFVATDGAGEEILASRLFPAMERTDPSARRSLWLFGQYDKDVEDLSALNRMVACTPEVWQEWLARWDDPIYHELISSPSIVRTEDSFKLFGVVNGYIATNFSFDD